MVRRCFSARTLRCTSPSSATSESCVTAPSMISTTRTGSPLSVNCGARCRMTNSSCSTNPRIISPTVMSDSAVGVGGTSDLHCGVHLRPQPGPSHVRGPSPRRDRTQRVVELSADLGEPLSSLIFHGPNGPSPASMTPVFGSAWMTSVKGRRRWARCLTYRYTNSRSIETSSRTCSPTTYMRRSCGRSSISPITSGSSSSLKVSRTTRRWPSFEQCDVTSLRGTALRGPCMRRGPWSGGRRTHAHP